MTDKIEPLNMHGHANTWEEELDEVCHERDALRAENERLRDEVTGLDALIDRGLFAEIERLRAALEEILGHTNEYSDDIAEIARKALAWYR